MSKEHYALEPEVVSVFYLGTKTDIIIRKNITSVSNEEDGINWECDEVQFRVDGSVTRETVLADLEYWWNYRENAPVTSDPQEQRLAKIEADIDYIAMMCDVEL